jgi:hypothetical protein
MRESPGEARLREAVRRLHGAPDPPALDVRPTNPFEVAVAERLKALEAELDQLRSRINWLLTVIVGAAITNIVIALLK